MKRIFSAALLFVMASVGVALGESAASLKDFKAQALAQFAAGELAKGEGVVAVRLSLEAVQTPDLSPKARSVAVNALAKSVSETDEFAVLLADDFGLESPTQVFGMFLPGARHYVAAANNGDQPQDTSVVILVDTRTGKVLDQRVTSLKGIIGMASDAAGQSILLFDGSLARLELLQIKNEKFDETLFPDFGDAREQDFLGYYYLSADGYAVLSIDHLDLSIASLDLATEIVSSAPADPTATGPAKLVGGIRGAAIVSSALTTDFDALGDFFSLSETTFLTSRRLLRHAQVVDAKTGQVSPVALPEEIRRRAGHFTVHPDGNRVLTWVRGKDNLGGLTMVSLDDPDFRFRFPDEHETINEIREIEKPIAFGTTGRHVLTATRTEIRTRNVKTGKLVGWYTYSDGAGGFPEFELSYSGDVIAVTEEDKIRFLRLFFEKDPHTTALSQDGAWIYAAHQSEPQDYISVTEVGGESTIWPIVDLKITRMLAGFGEAVAAFDADGRFHYWPNGLDGRRISPDIPAVDFDAVEFYDRAVLFGTDFVAIGGFQEDACGLWSLEDWRLISRFTHTHAGCHAEGFVLDSSGEQLAVLGGHTGNVSVYDTRTGEFLAHFRKREPLTDTRDISIRTAEFSNDGRVLHIIGSRGWRVDLDIETGALAWGDALERETYVMMSEAGEVTATTTYDENGQKMLVAGLLEAIRSPKRWRFSSVEFSADGKLLAAELQHADSNAVRLAIIDRDSGDLTFSYSLPLFWGHRATVMKFSPDGRWITALQRPGFAWTFPATEDGLVEYALTRFGQLTSTQACSWFLCD